MFDSLYKSSISLATSSLEHVSLSRGKGDGAHIYVVAELGLTLINLDK